MYQEFAYIYDKMMEDVDYIQWVDYIESLFSLYNVKPRDIADLACGTGNITTIMAERGYNMVGIDSSQDMLLVAQEKSRKKGLKIPFVCQDMREIALHRQADAVLIMCDGINYIIDDEDIDRVFSLIYNILRPGGVLLFDISSYYKLSTILGDNIIIDDDHGIFLVWENSFDTEENICTMDLTFFLQEDSLYRRFDEIHMQKAYHAQDLVDKLEQKRFKNINCYHHLSFDTPKKHSQRLMFAAQK